MSVWPYPSDFNPRAELNKKSEKYADYISYGLPHDKLEEYEPLPENTQQDMSTAWVGRPLWELWAFGKVYQYYIMQWVRSASTSNALLSLIPNLFGDHRRCSGRTVLSCRASFASYFVSATWRRLTARRQAASSRVLLSI